MSHTPTTLPIITIDGSSGAGKGTLTARLAERLNYAMLDSGALYRIVGLMAKHAHLLTDTIDEDQLTALTHSLDIQFLPTQSEHIGVWVNGQDLTQAIRTEEVGDYASKVAVFPKVRHALLDLQKHMAMPVTRDKQGNHKQGLVADGRDMGTVVFPQADLKIYLVASPKARATRRVNQLSQANQVADFEAILAQIIARDERDSNRRVAPAKPADDAIVIDSSDLTADAVFDQVWQLCQQRGLTY